MSYSSLPVEVLGSIFEYLHLADRLCASQVCKQWYFASLDQRLWQKVAIVLQDCVLRGMKVLKNSHCVIAHLILKEVDLDANCLEFWKTVGSTIVRLDFHSCELSEKLFVEILKECASLQALGINGCNGLFISETLLDRYSDITTLEMKLQNITELNLACNRYLSDALFNRIMRVIPKLEKLSVAGCQISFHPGIYKRFYPKDGNNTPSRSVLTFQNIISFIKAMNKTLKSLNFGRTLIDSRALSLLAKECGLTLKELYLISCEQLSKSGIMILCEHQPQLKVLDLSMSYQVPDQAVVYICENLLELHELSLRRCHNVTDRSVEAISKLNKLRKLDLSSCEKISPAGFKIALCSHPFLHLQYLNVSYCNISDEIAMSFVKCMPSLLHLDLTSCVNITDVMVHAISKFLVKLRTLRLAWCKDISDSGLTGKKPNTSSLQRSTFSYADSIPLVNMYPKCDRNSVSYCSNHLFSSQIYDEQSNKAVVSDDQPSLANVKGLRELDICGCVNITDEGFKMGISFLELHYLNLSLCRNITDEGLNSIGKYNPSIETLILSQCYKITDVGMTFLLRYLPRLKYLDLQGCKLVTDITLNNLKIYCTDLRYLDVSLCEKMTLEGVESFENSMPRLHTVHKRHVLSVKNEEKCDYFNF